MSMTDPPRLLEVRDAPNELRSLLALAEQDVLEAPAVARVTAGVQAGLGSPPTGSGPSSSGPSGAQGAGGGPIAGTSSAAAKVGAGMLVVAMVGGGVWLAGREPGGVAELPAPSASVLVVGAAEGPATAKAEQPAADGGNVAASAAPANEQGEASASRATPSGAGGQASHATASAPPRAGKSTPQPTPAELAEEHRLLRDARAALEHDPRRALGLCATHKQRFPSGVLAQEREVIAIDALARLGQTDAARSRAARFGEDYPDSPHRDRVGEATAKDGGRP